MISDNIKKMIVNDLKKKALENNEHQVYIKPSKYGLKHSSEETDLFLIWLYKNNLIVKGTVAGKDLIDCVVEEDLLK